MKGLLAWSAGMIAVIVYTVVLAWMDSRDRVWLRDDRITACRPPGDQGEKLVATLRKSADGVLAIDCAYHATQGFAP